MGKNVLCHLFGAVRANAWSCEEVARSQGYIVNTLPLRAVSLCDQSHSDMRRPKPLLVSMSEKYGDLAPTREIQVSCLCPDHHDTSTQGMKPWSQNVIMRGPAGIDGQEPRRGRQDSRGWNVCGTSHHPTHEEGWEIVKRRGASHNDFIRENNRRVAAANRACRGDRHATQSHRARLASRVTDLPGTYPDRR